MHRTRPAGRVLGGAAEPTLSRIRRYGRMAHLQHENQDSYRLQRLKPDGSVMVFNQDGFLMAEYSPITGAIAWHRVVPAAKRESVERRLSEQFPVVAGRNASANTSRSTRRKR